MEEAQNEITRLVKMESLTIPVEKILKAANHKDLSDALGEEMLPDDVRNQLTNQWRGYRQLIYDYTQDKQQAQKDLSKVLGTEIPAERVKQVFSDSVLDFALSDEKYQYIQDALNSEVMEEGTKDILLTARSNFEKLAGAIF